MLTAEQVESGIPYLIICGIRGKCTCVNEVDVPVSRPPDCKISICAHPAVNRSMFYIDGFNCEHARPMEVNFA